MPTESYQISVHSDTTNTKPCSCLTTLDQADIPADSAKCPHPSDWGEYNSSQAIHGAQMSSGWVSKHTIGYKCVHWGKLGRS
jgi:hypothetical protein